MLDHIFLTVASLERSILFYETTLAPLGITHEIDYDGKDGPADHPDLKGFGRDNRVFFWLRKGSPEPHAIHVGFVARSETEVQAFYSSAMAAGASDNGEPGARLHYDSRYYAANVLTLTDIAWKPSTRAGNTSSHEPRCLARAAI